MCLALCPCMLQLDYSKPVFCAMQAFADRQGKRASKGQDTFQSSIHNFYLTDVISRSSQTMAKCVQARRVMPTSFSGQVGPEPSYGVNKAGAN